MDYCVCLQTEQVAVLKNMSLSMSSSEYRAQPSDTAAETLQTGSDGMPFSNCSVFTMKTLFIFMTGNEGKQSFPFIFWGEKQKEKNVIMYTNASIKKEDVSARTVHAFAKAVHSGQAQRGGENQGHLPNSPCLYPWSHLCSASSQANNFQNTYV